MKNEREEEVGIDTLEKQFDREISKLLCLIMTNFQLKVSALSLFAHYNYGKINNDNGQVQFGR